MARLMIIPGSNEMLRALPTALSADIESQVIDSPNDALWEIRQSPPDVVIVDQNLPDMMGTDVVEIIPNFGIPTRVVLLSREPDEEVTRLARDAGVFALLTGNQTSDALREVVLSAVAAPPVTQPEPEPEPEPEPAPPTRQTTTRQPEASRTNDPTVTTSSRLARAVEAASRREASSSPAAREPEPEIIPGRRSSRRTGSLVFTAENVKHLRSRISDLNQEIGAQCILLTDRAGMVLTEVGDTSGIPTMILLPLLSTAFSAAGQISQLLRENDANALYMQEGTRYDLYCFDILQHYMLVIVFNRGVLASKIGTVWVYAKRAIRDIQEHLA
jgi:DNA-binding NarL/FixJ family response regulator